MASARERRMVASLAAAACLVLSPGPAVGAAPGDGALLVRGTQAVKGIPGFGENAFEALYGEYRLEGKAAPILVWATREPLYFSADRWNRRGRADLRAYDRPADKIDAVPPARGPYSLIAMYSPVSDWTVVAAFPAEGRSAEADRFFRLFMDRFAHFAAAAKLPTDVSFPAILGG